MALRRSKPHRTRKLYSFWIDATLAEGLKAIKTRDGIPESEQIRRAIEAWLEAKGVQRKSAGGRKKGKR
jgi:hypothetical protein